MNNKLSWRWRGYWLAHARRVLSVVIHLPLCLFGLHREAVGIFHQYIDADGEWDSYKCYHCLFCDAPIVKSRCGPNYEARLRAQQGHWPERWGQTQDEQ